MSVRAIEAEVSIKSGVQAECTIGREVVVEVHDDVNLESLTVTANGSYAPAVGVDGYSDVIVAIPERVPDIEGLTVTANGTYTAEGDGYNPVTVSVPERIPVTESLSVTENGTYNPDSGVDGYNRVTVAVPERQPDIESLTAISNGTYTSGKDGYNPVVVAVPPSVPDIEPLTVTEDGTYTASGDGYNPVTVNTGVESLRQEIASAETASGCSPLTDCITALTRYANEVTGQEDETLSDAVTRLVAGYSGGASLPSIISKIDGGSFTPISDEATSSYSISHNLGIAPTGVVIWATNIVKESYASRTVNMLQITDSCYTLLQVNTNGSDRVVCGALGSGNLGASSFKFTLSSNNYKSGVTYKWLAWA